VVETIHSLFDLQPTDERRNQVQKEKTKIHLRKNKRPVASGALVRQKFGSVYGKKNTFAGYQ